MVRGDQTRIWESQCRESRPEFTCCRSSKEKQSYNKSLVDSLYGCANKTSGRAGDVLGEKASGERERRWVLFRGGGIFFFLELELQISTPRSLKKPV